MEKFILLLSFLFLAGQIQGQGIMGGIYSGYGKIYDPGVVELTDQAQSILALQQSTMQVDAEKVINLKSSAEYTPMILQLSYGGIVEGGIKYQFNLSSPDLYYPIGSSDVIGVEEKYRSRSLSVFFRKNKSKCWSNGKYHFFGIEGGKRWGKKLISYTSEFKALDPTVPESTTKLKLKSNYFVTIDAGLGYRFSDYFAFEIAGFVSPFNNYQLDTRIDKVTTHRVGIVAGFKFAFDGMALPCL